MVRTPFSKGAAAHFRAFKSGLSPGSAQIFRFSFIFLLQVRVGIRKSPFTGGAEALRGATEADGTRSWRSSRQRTLEADEAGRAGS